MGHNWLDLCKTIELPKLHDDRGSLSFVETGVHLDFAIQRIYYLYDIAPQQVRGAHAHRELNQLLIAISGSFVVDVWNGTDRKSIRLDRPNQGLRIPPMTWRDLSDFSPGAVCLVLASLPYSEAEYIRSMDEFKALVKVRQQVGEVPT